jgi:hypothetical protein
VSDDGSEPPRGRLRRALWLAGKTVAILGGVGAAVLWASYALLPLAQAACVLVAATAWRASRNPQGPEAHEVAAYWRRTGQLARRITVSGIVFTCVSLATAVVRGPAARAAGYISLLYCAWGLVVGWKRFCAWMRIELEAAEGPRKLSEFVRRALPYCPRLLLSHGRGAPVIVIVFVLLTMSVCGSVTFITANPAWAAELAGRLVASLKQAKNTASGDGGNSGHDDPPTCPGLGAIRTSFQRGMHDDWLAAYLAWKRVGAPVVGCPQRFTYKDGVWLVELAGGEEVHAYVISVESSAGVVYESDFAPYLVEHRASLAWISGRSRWGYGTMQFTVLRDGTCQLLQRYESVEDQTEALPPAVTRIALGLARQTNAYPQVTKAGDNGVVVTYDVRLLAPRPTGKGVRVIDSIVVKYSGQEHKATSPSMTATDQDPCIEPGALLTSPAGLLQPLADAVNDAMRRAA